MVEAEKEGLTPKKPALQPSQPKDGESTSPATMEQAMKFLQEDEVRLASRERKLEFLKSKGFQESQVVTLLDKEESEDAPSETQEPPKDKPLSSSEAPTRVSSETKSDHPPIVTYPEFLTKPAKPPPLMTVPRFLNALSAFSGLSTLIYGTSKFILSPMADSLTEARVDLHGTAAQNLAKLVEKLEGIVSEIPNPEKTESHKQAREDDDAGSYDDPTELFHRDIGIQTSLPSSPTFPPEPSPSNLAHPAGAQQAEIIEDLTASIKAVGDGFVTQSEEYADIRTVLSVFQDDIDRLAYPAPADFVGGYSLYGSSSRNEPDDEIKKAKENIRRVKGLLLGARTFPASTR